MKRISMTALSVFALIIMLLSTALAQSFQGDPQTHISDQQNNPDDKTPPVKPPPEIGPPEKPSKTCPQTRYIDCMPPVTDQARPMCSREYLAWIKEHCPGVEVVY